MSSNLANLGKSLSQPAQYTQPPQQNPSTSSTFETRRPSQSPSTNSAAPRKAQGARQQHRAQRRALRTAAALIDADDFTMTDPSPRGGNGNGNGSRRRGQTSITHLLNNYRAPVPVPGMDDYSTFARSYRRNPTWGPGSGYRQSDKLRYVRANYRFVLRPLGTYAALAADADAHVDWASVLQVVASSQSQATSCPICLSEPVAPRMAQCGHIFCLPCLLRYQSAVSPEDEGVPAHQRRRWKKCPICEDRIQLPDTRPVRFYWGQESPLPRPGEDVVLRLMVRSASSTLAMPREGGTEALDGGDDIPWYFAANVMDYGRVMKGDAGYMVGQYDEEIAALEEQGREDECMFGSDGEWTRKAVRAIEAAKESIVQDLGSPEDSSTSAAPAAAADGEAAASSSGHNRGRGKQVSVHDFYFYSAPPHLYLSPLDIRILKTKYGDFSLFPSTLLPRVEHISTGHVVDDALRRRAKYLSHLPRGCLVSFLECDWTDIVPEEILQQFHEEIQKRRKRNHDKDAQEERLRVRAERAEAAALSKGVVGVGATSIKYSASSVREEVGEGSGGGVDFSEEDFAPLGRVTSATSAAGEEERVAMGTSPTTGRTVWGTRAVAAAAEQERVIGDVDDGWLRDEDILGDASIAAQLEALGVEDVGEVQHAADVNGVPGGTPKGGGGGGKGKKKKKQKITLMSTGGKRGL